MESWKDERDTELQQLTDDATALLADRTVVHVVAVPHSDECDGTNVLRLTLDDGSIIDITAGYGGYTGRSCDEYVEVISIDRVPS